MRTVTHLETKAILKSVAALTTALYPPDLLAPRRASFIAQIKKPETSQVPGCWNERSLSDEALHSHFITKGNYLS